MMKARFYLEGDHVGINRITLKQHSKQLLRTSNPNLIIMGLIYFGIVYILTNLSSRLTGIQVDMTEYANALETMDVGYFRDTIANYNPSAGAVLIDIAIRILRLILHVGMVIFVLNTFHHREESSYYNILDGFSVTGRTIVLYLLMGIFVFLWSLLFIIPGIIAFYRYRMSLFIMLEHPELSPVQCIEESKRLMNGYKSELFLLDLSFLGWIILSIIPFVSAYVIPYMLSSFTGFYESLKTIRSAQTHDYTGYDSSKPDIF